MSDEGTVAVRIVGLPAICRPAHEANRSKALGKQEASKSRSRKQAAEKSEEPDKHKVEELGTVTDVGVGERGCLQWLRYRSHWRGSEICVPADSFHVESGALLSSRRRVDLEACPQQAEPGLIGVSVRTREGEDLGKIANALVEPASLYLLGLELSNGLIRDWARGRPLVVLEPGDGVGERHDRHLVLTSDARVAPPSPGSGLGAGTEELLTDKSPGESLPLVRPIDWMQVRSLSEDQICQKMAQVIWERRGSPKEGKGPEDLLDMATPWAKQLKEAAESGNRDALDDLALLSSEHVEALRVFRVGAEPSERGEPSEHPEGAVAGGALNT